MPPKQKVPQPPPTVSRVEQIRRLKLFNSKIDLLRRGRFLEQLSQPDSLGIKLDYTAADPQRGISIQQRGADEEAVLALVTTLRFFVQEGDYIRIDQIVALYDSLPVENAAKEGAHKALNSFDAYMARPIGFIINGENPTNRELFDGFMYGGLAHAKDNRYPQYERWTNTAFTGFFHFVFQEIAANIFRTAAMFYQLNQRTVAMLEAEEAKAAAVSVSGTGIL